MNRRHLCLALASASAFAVACGGGAPAREPKASGSAAEPEPRTIEEAEDQIARAKAELAGGPAARPVESDAPKDLRPKTEPSPPPPPPAPPSSSTSEEPHGFHASCASSCRALASMRRAVEALCRMTGDTDARCTGAKRTLDENTSRVASCQC